MSDSGETGLLIGIDRGNKHVATVIEQDHTEILHTEEETIAIDNSSLVQGAEQRQLSSSMHAN